MKRTFQNLWNNHKEKQKKQHEQIEANAFNITEKNGVIYIIAGTRAIKTIPQEATALDIVNMLKECRKAQMNYIK